MNTRFAWTSGLPAAVGLAVLLFGLTLGGCDDDDPTEPGTQTGDVIVDVSPDSITVSWTLTGPAGFLRVGEGDQTFPDRAPGTYTIEWGTVVGYTAPPNESLGLTGTDDVVFTGTYTQNEPFVGRWVAVPVGTFSMGAPRDEPGWTLDDARHEVTLTTPFTMWSTEVTNAQYAELAQWALDQGHCTASADAIIDALDGSTALLVDLAAPSSAIDFADGTFTVENEHEQHPVTNVSWYGAAAYCDWLSLREGLPRAYDHATWRCNEFDPYAATGYRLPTEAEWELACRAGESAAFANGPILDTVCDDPHLGAIGWYCGNTDEGPRAVARLNANAFGLFDLHGNVEEWVNDRAQGYREEPAEDPVGPREPRDTGVVRGGNWDDDAIRCRAASRSFQSPEDDFAWFGFRPVRSTP